MENSKVKSTAYLTQIYGENTNRKFKLMCTKVTIGRSFHAEIRLQNPNISRSHCTLFYDKGWSISDNKSQNGTYVSGRKLKPGETRPLQCGDIIFLGPPSEMPEAFCYDDAFIDDEDMPEIGHEIIELPPAKRPAAEEMIASKRKSLESESSDNEFDKLLASSLSNRLIHKIEFASQSTEPYDSSKQIDNQLLQKNLSPLKIKSVKDFKSLSQQDQAVTMTQTAYSVSVHSPPSKQSKLYNSDSGYQINEISSTGDDQAEDSLSLLDIEKNEIVEPSCSTSCTKSPSSVQDSETSREVDILKSKLALMAEQIKKIEESKLDLLKNYEVVCEKNFALDQQLVEKKKIEEDLKNCELKMQDKIKNELLEKFEEDLICNICTELLIKPTVLDCSHTYCLFCIKEWRKKKNECPICRRKITTMTPVLTLEHFIDKALSTLTPEQKEKRNQLIIERENQPKKVATPTSRRYRGRRRYRRSYTSINQDIRQMINQSRENDVQIVGERRAVLPMPIPPIAMSSVYLRIPRMPDMLLNSNPGEDPISVYLG